MKNFYVTTCLIMFFLHNSVALSAEQSNLLLMLAPIIASNSNASDDNPGEINSIVMHTYCSHVSNTSCPRGIMLPQGTAVKTVAYAMSSGGRVACKEDWVWKHKNPVSGDVLERAKEDGNEYHFFIGPAFGSARVEAYCEGKKEVVGRDLISGDGGLAGNWSGSWFVTLPTDCNDMDGSWTANFIFETDGGISGTYDGGAGGKGTITGRSDGVSLKWEVEGGGGVSFDGTINKNNKSISGDWWNGPECYGEFTSGTFSGGKD